MADTPKQLPRRARALAAWESAVARTFNPHLNERRGKALWDAVLKNRSEPNADTFAKALADVLDGAPTPIRQSAGLMVANLRDVLAITD